MASGRTWGAIVAGAVGAVVLWMLQWAADSTPATAARDGAADDLIAFLGNNASVLIPTVATLFIVGAAIVVIVDGVRLRTEIEKAKAARLVADNVKETLDARISTAEDRAASKVEKKEQELLVVKTALTNLGVEKHELAIELAQERKLATNTAAALSRAEAELIGKASETEQELARTLAALKSSETSNAHLEEALGHAKAQARAEGLAVARLRDEKRELQRQISAREVSDRYTASIGPALANRIRIESDESLTAKDTSRPAKESHQQAGEQEPLDRARMEILQQLHEAAPGTQLTWNAIDPDSQEGKGLIRSLRSLRHAGFLNVSIGADNTTATASFTDSGVDFMERTGS